MTRSLGGDRAGLCRGVTVVSADNDGESHSKLTPGPRKIPRELWEISGEKYQGIIQRFVKKVQIYRFLE